MLLGLLWLARIMKLFENMCFVRGGKWVECSFDALSY